jgi:predicted MPP superfamily phosphohydrolase
MNEKRLTRRRFLMLGSRIIIGGSFASLLGAIYATEVEPSIIEVTRVKLSIPGLPDGLDSLTIAQLSDFHVGPYVTAEHVRRSVAMTNALGADVVVLTGDFVFQSAVYAFACAQELAGLKSRYGVYAVLGNHDIGKNADQVTANLSKAGIIVLHNEALPLFLGKSILWLVGLEDVYFKGGLSDFKAAWNKPMSDLALMLKGLPPNDPRILLVHRPDCTELLPQGRIDLTLCGHTHGGQVRLPLLGSPIIPSFFGQKYASGLVHNPHTTVYVNRGIGLITPAVRFNCPPEITLFHLSKA